MRYHIFRRGSHVYNSQNLPVYEMGTDMHTHIDPIEEAEAMVGKDRVIVVKPESFPE